jgi:hypothetical protein
MQPRETQSQVWVAPGAARDLSALRFLVAAAAIAAAASAFGIARDYGYLHASMLTGSPGGQYHALAMRLADRVSELRPLHRPASGLETSRILSFRTVELSGRNPAMMGRDRATYAGGLVEKLFHLRDNNC